MGYNGGQLAWRLFMVIIMAIFEQYHCHDAISYGYPTFMFLFKAVVRVGNSGADFTLSGFM